jgi:ribonuclease HI
MPRWQSNGWKTASGKPVANRDELEILLIAKQGLDVKWVGAMELILLRTDAGARDFFCSDSYVFMVFF